MKQTKKRLFSVRTIVHLLATMFIPLAVAYTAYEVANKPEASIGEQSSQPTTKVLANRVFAGPHRASVVAFGEAQSHFELNVQAQVQGKITQLSDDFVIGKVIKAGTPLVEIDAIDYHYQLEQAQKRVQQAQLAYLQEQSEAQHAKKQWQADKSGSLAANDLVFRKPHVAIADAERKVASAALKQAERDLDNTKIVTPFDAVVVERHVTLGQFLNVGDSIATVHSNARVNIKVQLPALNWPLLPNANQLMLMDNIELYSETGERWLGHITEVDQHVNPLTRQRGLTISVFSPLTQTTALLAGTFLTVEIPGLRFDNLLSVPANSLSNQGHIWYINSAEQIFQFKPQVAFERQGRLYIHPPTIDGQVVEHLDIVENPLPLFVAGQKVEPQFITGGLARE